MKPRVLGARKVWGGIGVDVDEVLYRVESINFFVQWPGALHFRPRRVLPALRIQDASSPISRCLITGRLTAMLALIQLTIRYILLYCIVNYDTLKLNIL